MEQVSFNRKKSTRSTVAIGDNHLKNNLTYDLIDKKT